MSARFSFVTLLLFTLLSTSSARAQPQPHDPIVLWGIHQNCQMDRELSQAVQDRLDALGAPLFPIAPLPGRLESCLGSECLDLLAQSCDQRMPERGVLIGGHVAEQRAEGRYLARIRVFRVDFEQGRASRSFYRYERIERPCSGSSCREGLATLMATIVGQLLEDSQPSSEPPGVVINLRPPYCNTSPAPADFLCQPFALRQACLADGADGALQCPFSQANQTAPLRSKPGCSCAEPSTCTAEERLTCTTPVRSPVLRRAVGGTLLAAGIALLGTGLMLTLNDYTSLSLLSSPACSYGGGDVPEKCFAPLPAVITPWVAGVGLTVGGIMVLLDPLALFRDRPSRQTP